MMRSIIHGDGVQINKGEVRKNEIFKYFKGGQSPQTGGRVK